MTRLFSFAILLALPLALSCGSSSSSQNPGGSNNNGAGTGTASEVADPCTLVSIAEIQPIVEKTITDAQASTGIAVVGDRACDWSSADGHVQLSITSSPPRDGTFGSVLSGDNPISGVGDSAYASSFAAIFVKVGSHEFMAQSLVPVKDGQVGPEVRAARAADASAGDLSMYEAAFRLAKIFAAKF